MVSLCNLAAANHFHIDFDFMPELNLLRLYFHLKNPIRKLNQRHPRISSLTSSVKKPALTLFIISAGWLFVSLTTSSLSMISVIYARNFVHVLFHLMSFFLMGFLFLHYVRIVVHLDYGNPSQILLEYHNHLVYLVLFVHLVY